MNVYFVRETKDFVHHINYEEYAFHKCTDFVFRKTTSKNMDKLWEYFYKNESYPEYYLGVVKKAAICKCQITGKEEWFNGDRCLTVENPTVGSTVTVKVHLKNKTYTRDFIFMGWVKSQVHEWSMRNGSTLQLEQQFIDGLLPQDKRYLKINI